MDRKMDGYTDRWIERWMNRHTGGWTDVLFI